MYNIGKMRHMIKILTLKERYPVQPLGTDAEYRTLATDIPAQRIKRLDKESITLTAQHNYTRVDFIIRARELEPDWYIECDGIKHNILGSETLKDDPGFLLISAVEMR